MTEISDTLLKQRLRNRIIENLGMFANTDIEKIGTDEAINGWYDVVDYERLGFYDEPVFTKNEINALKSFHNLLESTYEKIPTTWLNSDLKDNLFWHQLEKEAKHGLSVFMERGRLDEENEVT